MIVESQMRDFAKGQGVQVASDVKEAMDAVVEQLLKKACDRAKGNARKTLRAVDF